MSPFSTNNHGASPSASPGPLKLRAIEFPDQSNEPIVRMTAKMVMIPLFELLSSFCLACSINLFLKKSDFLTGKGAYAIFMKHNEEFNEFFSFIFFNTDPLLY